jgi:Ca-activated chloride channel family protein
MRGEIKDEKNAPIQNARIFVHSAKAYFYSGTTGGFGITMNNLYDSITVTKDGYEPVTLKVKTDVWQNITLKIAAATASKNRPRLISITKDKTQGSRFNWFPGDETYFQLVENSFVDAGKYPNTGFALNVNKASYSNVRRFLNMGSPVPPDAVRVEEMINYFNLCYEKPEGSNPFKISSQLTDCPWDAKKQLLCLNVSAKMLPLDKIPPGNFVFLIDISGSMDMPNRLSLIQAAFKMFVKNLRPVDSVSIVTYGGSVGVWLRPTSGANKDKINEAIESLVAAGDTPGESAIMAAYRLAQSTYIKNGNNRVILATDGDFNVGETSEKALEELIVKQKETGVYLTCLGVGMGNYKDSKLQTLAKKGNGNYAYLDDIREAEKVLIQELTQTFYTVGDNVSMNISFDPSQIKEYRLIGFDNRKDAVSDSMSVLEGGEVGSGNNTLAMFEIIPQPGNPPSNRSLAKLVLQYSNPRDTATRFMNYDVMPNYVPVTQLSQPYRFVIATAMFGLKLKQSPYFSKSIGFDEIRTFADAAADKSNYVQAEMLALIEKASGIYDIKKKKKKIRF